MDTPNKKLSMEDTPFDFYAEIGRGNISKKTKALLLLIELYRENKDDLFWVLHHIRLRIQNDEASHLADALIRRVKNEKPKA